MTQPPMVYEAISAVMERMSREGIAKDRRNQQQGYAFRGIDDVYNALGKVLAENRLVMLPRVVGKEREERQSAKGGMLMYTILTVEFDLVSAKDGTSHTICMVGEAMDSADKSSNKSQSAALKYAALQVFMIPTEGDNDADGQTHEVSAAPQREQPAPLRGKYKTRASLRTACGEFVRELHSCEDEDTLDGFLATDDAIALVDQVKAEHPFFWEGDGADFLGLEKEIKRRRELIGMDNNAGERQPIFAAG